jgi:D-alanyl-D-alanine carboxypeptidase/D-alanyl-D-alanine-endopeptidase (penicillin-binding protein 4)
MKMKSGSIGGARSFAGYHTSKDGNEYIFAIIVNNYDGSSSAMVRKMYQLLDNLK